MTIGFAGSGDDYCCRICISHARRACCWCLCLIVGFASVEYWAWTESRGAGDLRPYAIVQFLPMLIIPVILLTHKPVIGEARYFWWMLVVLPVGQAAGVLRRRTSIAFGHLISGHSLKHVAAAMTPVSVPLYALIMRRRLFT